MKKSDQKTEIPGVEFFKLETFEDERGSLIELFRNDCLNESNHPVMAYISETKAGVTRGPHEHKEQSDLFCFFGPADFELTLWHTTSWGGFIKETHFVGSGNPVAVIVPPGIVHAYKNISSFSGLVFNAPNKLYAGPGKCHKVDEIRYEDFSNSPYK